MALIRKISIQLLILLASILLLLLEAAMDITLPSFHRKGNVLTNIFIFITSLLESLVAFEKGLLSKPFLFSHKGVKQTLFVISWALFVISYFEFSGTTAAPPGNTISWVERLEPAGTHYSAEIAENTASSTPSNLQFWHSEIKPRLLSTRDQVNPSPKKFLRFRNLRI